MPGKRVQIDEETWSVLDLIGKRSGRDFQALADEAFADLIAKHGEAKGLAAQLRGSLAAPGKPARTVAQSRKR
jgi:hypothetical protein